LVIFLYLAILHSPNSSLLVAALLKSPRTLAKSFPTVPQVSDLLLLWEEMVVNFIIPEVNPFPSFLSLPHLFIFWKSTYLAFFFFPFFVLPIFKP